MPQAARPVEIWIRIEKDEDGFPKSQDWEDLWAWPVSDGTFRVDSIPFFANGLAAGDIVTAVRAEKGYMVVDQIIARSGHSTFRVWLADGYTSDSRDELRAALQRSGARTEVTLERLLAIDIAPDRESTIWDYLESGEQQELWHVQVGHSPERNRQDS